jgi:hypothetical protein
MAVMSSRGETSLNVGWDSMDRISKGLAIKAVASMDHL